MPPLLIVEAYVASQRVAQLLVDLERHSVQRLRLHGVEERFHVRVIVHLARPVHALPDTKTRQVGSIIIRCVFHAPVAVEHQTGGRLTLAHGVPQCRTRERGVAPAAHAPAHQASGMPVHHRSQAAPLPRHPQVRDVTDPGRVGRTQGHVLQGIGYAGKETAVSNLGSALQAGLLFSPDLVSVLAHPIMVKQDVTKKRWVLAQTLYSSLGFTQVLEHAVINDAVFKIARRESGFDLPAELQVDAWKILVDESFHGKLVFDLEKKVEWGTKIPEDRHSLCALPRSAQENREIQGMRPPVPVCTSER